MVCKCPNCGDAITYSIKDKSWKCSSCKSTLDSNSIITEALWSQLETMNFNIYKCSTCGAEITVNDVEAATFCGFCGQPTILFDRVSSMAKPQKIIPFKVTKEEAEKLLLRRLRKSFYTKKSVKNIELDRVCGIYVPFWVYDIDYSSSVLLSGKFPIIIEKELLTRYFRRRGKCSFKNVTFDASKELENHYSERLVPFNCKEMVDFDASYLSGFYADCYDEDLDTSEYSVLNIVKEAYNSKIKQSVHTAFSVKIESEVSSYKIKSAYYALLPVWFLSFSDDDINYTMMVNGQTGKVVGATPFVKSNFNKFTFLSGVAISIPLIFLINLVTDYITKFNLFTLITLFSIGLIFIGKKFLNKLYESLYYTTLHKTKRFANKR